MTIQTSQAPVTELPDLIPSWVRALRARNLSSKTIRSYGATARQFAAFLVQQGMPTDVTRITVDHRPALEEPRVAGDDPRAGDEVRSANSGNSCPMAWRSSSIDGELSQLTASSTRRLCQDWEFLHHADHGLR